MNKEALDHGNAGEQEDIDVLAENSKVLLAVKSNNEVRLKASPSFLIIDAQIP